ncbi:MAG: ABC transporter transmembrane domain-containing protein, partial [Planctomycetaceae bacterium]
MTIFTRLIPYVWPDRKKVILSFIFAIVVAFLWGANLTIAFPIVKVLLERQSLADYVAHEIQTAETDMQNREKNLEHIETVLKSNEQKGTLDDKLYNSLLRDRDHQQNQLAKSSHTLMAMHWAQMYVIPWVPRDEFDTLMLILVVLMTATLLKNVAIFIQNILIGSVVELTVMRLRKECLKRTLHLDYQTISQAGTGNLMSRFTYDMAVLANGLNLLGGKLLREPLKAVACIIFAFYVNWQLTLLSLVVVPILGVIFTKFGRMLKQSSQASMESMSKVYKSLEETLESIKVVIAFNGYRKHRRRFHQENKEYYRKSMQLITVDGLTSPLTELLGFIAVYIALLPGAYLVLRGTTSIWGIKLASEPMDIAELSVLYALLAGVLDPGRKLSSVFSRLKQSAVAAERIFELIDRRTLVQEAEEPRELPRHAQSIQFRNIDFQYATLNDTDLTRPPSLDGVTLRVNAGDVIAIVGSNGSGKSTLVNLLPRYFDQQSGQVLIDDVDV